VVCLALISPSAVHGEDPKPSVLDAKELATKIDEMIVARLERERLQQSPLCDDETFIRRAYLDLVGCIPNGLEMRDYLSDRRADKRRLLVDELLAGKRSTSQWNAYARHFAQLWRSWLLSRQPIEQQVQARDLEDWLEKRLASNDGLDRLTRGVIQQATYIAAYPSPEARAGATSRLFLGVKLECAQCHNDRSGGSWTVDEFWSFAAFFVDGRSIPIPGKNKMAAARFLGGAEPEWKTSAGPAGTLAEWITRPDNPYFAKAAVNRIWAYLLGTGFVEPLDGWNDSNQASHPELLDLMAEQFAAHNFDLKYLIRSIMASRTYQASSAALADEKAMDSRLFARAVVRGLSAEQLFDSLALATEFCNMETRLLDGTQTQARTEFVIRFTEPGERPIDASATVPEALFFMNSDFAIGRTSLAKNKTLATIADWKDSTTARRVEKLYLLVLSRHPRPEEAERMAKYVEDGGATKDKREALADVYWALLNSAEFRTNH
jgi:hypothetical protein